MSETTMNAIRELVAQGRLEEAIIAFHACQPKSGRRFRAHFSFLVREHRQGLRTNEQNDVATRLLAEDLLKAIRLAESGATEP